MADFTGIFTGASANLTTDLVKKSFGAQIVRYMPNGSSPLFALSSMLPSETAVQTEHGFFTKTMIFPSVTLNGAISATTTTVLTVTDTSKMIVGMILQAGTTTNREQMVVDSIISATQIKVTRGFGVTAAQSSIADATVLYMVGNAYEEASTRPNALNINPVRVTNYTQIFRNTWAISDTIRNTYMIAGDSNGGESKMDCAAFHSTAIESAALFAEKQTGTRNGQPFRTMDGLQSIISQYSSGANITNAGSTTTFAQLETAFDVVFNTSTDPKGGNNRMLFVGGGARKVINNIGRLQTNANINISSGQTDFGMQFDTVKMTRGTFQMVEHPLLNTNALWAKYAFIVDMASFRFAYLGDRKTQYKSFNASNEEAADNGIDAVGGTLTTELTTVIKNPAANAWIYGMTAAAAG